MKSSSTVVPCIREGRSRRGGMMASGRSRLGWAGLGWAGLGSLLLWAGPPSAVAVDLAWLPKYAPCAPGKTQCAAAVRGVMWCGLSVALAAVGGVVWCGLGVALAAVRGVVWCGLSVALAGAASSQATGAADLTAVAV